MAGVIPGPAAEDVGRAAIRSDRINSRACWIVVIPVLAPFINIAMYVIKPPWIRLLLTDWLGHAG